MPSFIITGGPGSGKSTLLNALEASGFQTIPEVSRELIRAEMGAGGMCLPWIDLPCFARKCLEKMQADFLADSTTEPVFFDRGLPDIIAYLNVGKITIDPALLEVCSNHRYNTNVFIAPPWKEIYVNDDERWQTFAEACTLYEAIKVAYTTLGYRLTELPKVSAAERADFIIKQIAG
ncbi:AAA family ATPase [Dyadobacter sp. CY343]|uniref:AAA family ATPase n=1 Tax=Dyadobacter sp. CY343 TaxID=2907299 RepID=UPI001F32E7DA|nr:AAA family ATPase [Dyadobacter sp. CY343]MCE7059164.1 AAA family ATPase [Dyadobacter sp. CY343]